MDIVVHNFLKGKIDIPKKVPIKSYLPSKETILKEVPFMSWLGIETLAVIQLLPGDPKYFPAALTLMLSGYAVAAVEAEIIRRKYGIEDFF